MISKHSAPCIKQNTSAVAPFKLVAHCARSSTTSDNGEDYIPLQIKCSALQKLLYEHSLVAEDFCCENTEAHLRIRQLLLGCLAK